ncbi:MAG TPA: chloride channel protein [Pelobium sp.]|nr:chloride channel protein [Pelobium sp.]
MKNTTSKVQIIGLVVSSIVVSIISVILADSLKSITEHAETFIFNQSKNIPLLYIVLPSIGITAIYFLRKYVFRGKANKGIKEIYQSIDNSKNTLPAFKIPSHYLNGFLTVIFGGSTGIEVSTVVATAAVGTMAQRNISLVKAYKTELICAAVAAGIAILFASPIAGFFFAIEVIARKNVSKTNILSSACAVLVAWLSLMRLNPERILDFTVDGWNGHAIPYLIVLSLACSFLAIYFTKTVIFLKKFFGNISNNFLRVNSGALLVGISILAFPQLYGDSYHALNDLLFNSHVFSIQLTLVLLALVFLKPLVAALTLGAGGDGGVFAPSIVAGAILGISTALLFNYFFNADLVVLNFAIVGGVAVLSAAIDAPLTSIFLGCNLVTGGYVIFIPIAIGCFIAKYTAKYFCSYTVYSYKGK